jgi:hypothetical protein
VIDEVLPATALQAHQRYMWAYGTTGHDPPQAVHDFAGSRVAQYARRLPVRLKGQTPL